MKRFSHSALGIALAILMVAQVVAIAVLALPATVLSAGAEAPSEEVTHMKPTPKENIILNAYLFPVFDDADLRTQMQYCKDADIDVISNCFNERGFVPELHTLEWYTYLMATAAEYGLTLQTRDVRLQNGIYQSDEQLIALANEYKDLPGFGGFYIVDEPTNPNPYARIENALRSVCPDTLVNVNFLPRACYLEGDYIRQLTDYGSLLKYPGTLSLDAYCFGNNGGVDEASLFSNYDDLRRAALMTGNDTAVYVQSVGSPKHFGYRRPSGDDLRYNMMAALAYGIKEIKFFCWGTPLDGTVENNVYTDAIIGMDNKPTDLYDAVCDINAYVHAIGQYIAACDALEVYHSNGRGGYMPPVPGDLFIQPADESRVIISLMQERDGDAEYVMIVNKDFQKEQTVTFTVNGLKDLQIVDTDGHLKALPLTDGQFTLTFAASDSVVIKLPKGDYIRSAQSTDADLATGSMVSATSSYGAEKSYLYNIYDGKYDGTGARLTSEDTEAEYVTFDLGSVQTINRVDVYPAGEKAACGAYYPNVTMHRGF